MTIYDYTNQSVVGIWNAGSLRVNVHFILNRLVEGQSLIKTRFALSLLENIYCLTDVQINKSKNDFW